MAEVSDYKISYPHYIGTLDSFISQYVFMPFGHLVMECTEKPVIIQDFSINILNYSKNMWQYACHHNGCNPLDFYYDDKGVLANLNKKLNSCPIVNNKPCNQFKAYCYSHGFATYQDVMMIALRVLRYNPQIAKMLINRFPVLLIDEAQDTSAEQMKFIDILIHYGHKDITLIGDPDQAIYEWRDADPSVFLSKFESDSWNSRILNENFRCSQNICNVTKAFSTLNQISKAIGKSAEDKFVPEIIKYDPKNKQCLIEYFLSTCVQHNIDLDPEKVAVLVRGKSGLLGKDYSQIEDLWQNQSTELLAQATYEKGFGSLNRAITLIEKALYSIYISSDICNEIDKEEISKVLPADKWRKIVGEFCKSIPPPNTTLKEWKVEVMQLIKQISLKYCLNIIGSFKIKTKCTVRNAVLSDFLEQPVKDFFAKAYEDIYLNATVHAVKGRTFEAVLLIVGTNGKLTSKMLNTYLVDSEPVRTAYVAMTRARRILMVAIPKSIKDASLTRFSSANWKMVSLTK